MIFSYFPEKIGCNILCILSSSQCSLLTMLSVNTILVYFMTNTVEPQWHEHLWDHGNSFDTWVIRATEG